MTAPLTGRCYCGETEFSLDRPPLTVAYCHCGDCRRWTGAPVAVFVALHPDQVQFGQSLVWKSHAQGVRRANCPDCGSPLAAEFDYLPGQTYMPVGIFDTPDLLPPQLHAHSDARVSWLHLRDDLPKSGASARGALLSSGAEPGTDGL